MTCMQANNTCFEVARNSETKRVMSKALEVVQTREALQAIPASALHIACKNGDVEAIYQLTKEGRDVDERTSVSASEPNTMHCSSESLR